MAGLDPNGTSGSSDGFFGSDLFKLLLGGMGGAAGAIPTPQNQTGTGTSTTNTQGETNTSTSGSNASTTNALTNFLNSLTGKTSGTTSTTPNLSPGTQQLLDKLISSYSTFSKPVDLSGYQAQQTQGINRNADLAKQSADATMAARGLSTSPVSATTDMGIDNARYAQINNLNAGLPQLANTQNLQNLGAAASFMNLIPKGSTTTNDQSQTQDQSGQQGSTTGTQGFTNNYGYQSNNQSVNNQYQNKTQSQTGGGLGGLLGGLGSVLGSFVMPGVGTAAGGGLGKLLGGLFG